MTLDIKRGLDCPEASIHIETLVENEGDELLRLRNGEMFGSTFSPLWTMLRTIFTLLP